MTARGRRVPGAAVRRPRRLPRRSARIAPRPDRDVVAELTPWPRSRSLVFDLRHAPELAVLAVLHAALRAALAALVAEHPTLADLGPPDDPPTLRHAHSLVRAGLVLGGALDTYRNAALAAFRVTPRCDDDDSPF